MNQIDSDKKKADKNLCNSFACPTDVKGPPYQILDAQQQQNTIEKQFSFNQNFDQNLQVNAMLNSNQIQSETVQNENSTDIYKNSESSSGNLNVQNPLKSLQKISKAQTLVQNEFNLQNVSMFELELPFEDKIASMPQFFQLFDELQKDLQVLVGKDAKNEVIIKNERPVKQQEQEILQNQDIWLKFIKQYTKNTQQVINDHFERIQSQNLEKQLQIYHRINEQGISCSKEEEQVYYNVNSINYKEKKNFDLIGQNNLLDKNIGIVSDIDGSVFNNFQNCCMILLTSQKPSSVPENSKLKAFSQQHLVNNQSQKFDQNNGNQFQKYNSSQPKSSQKIQQNECALIASNSYNISQEKVAQGNEQEQLQIKAAQRNQFLEKDASTSLLQNNQQLQNSQVVFPQKRYSHSANLIDGKLYVFGGVHRTGSGQTAFHSFYECHLNLESSKEDLFKWKKILVEAPKNRDSHSCVSFLEQLLIFGGSCNDKSFNDLYKYNITAKMWQKLDPIYDKDHLPSPREGHIAVMIEDDKMLVHGGINEKCEVFDDAFVLVGLHQEIDIVQSEIKYDGKSKISNVLELKQRRGKFEMLRWYKCDQEGNIPSARDSHSATVFNSKVFIFGGQDKDEQLLDDFYIVSMIQGQKTVLLDNNDKTGISFTDRTFKLVWTEIKKPSYVQKQISTNYNYVNWPIKRSSHSMNLFQNRFLVLIGGETNKDDNVKQNDVIMQNNDPDQLIEISSNKKTNKSLADIWIYDIYLQKWKEIKPPIKVQNQFNNKKMRKSFEPRMAHSATIYGNYIIIFGGYCAQSEQYCQQNLSVLSLLGCTDYMLNIPSTLKMLKEQQIEIQNSENDFKTQNDLQRILLQNTINSFSHPNKINSKSSKNIQKPALSNNSTQLDVESLKKSNSVSQKFNNQNTEIQQFKPLLKQKMDQSCQTFLLQQNQKQLSIQKQQLFPYKDFLKMAKQIPNTIQLFVNVLKQQIQSFTTLNQEIQQKDEQLKIIKNASEFQSYKINISLIESNKNQIENKILKVEDNSQGLMLLNFRNLLEGKSGSLTSCSFKLCESALVISRCQKLLSKSQIKQEFQIQKLRSQNEFKHVYEVHIGLISQNFIEDSGSSNIVAPLVSFQFVKKSKKNIQKIGYIDSCGSSIEQNEDFIYELEAITPQADRFFNLIFDYLRPSILLIFKNVQEIKNYILEKAFQINQADLSTDTHKGQQNLFQTGTEIFFCNLKFDIQNIDSDLIFLQHKNEEKNQNKNILDLSLLKNLNFGYIDFPPEVSICINDKCQKIDNPFREIIQYVINDEKLAMKGNQQKFKYWITSEQAIIQAYKNNNHDEKENSIEQILQGFEGIMLFKGNEFIVKDNLCQPGGWNIEGITLQSILQNINELQDEEQLQYFQNYFESIQSWDRLHGIIMIDDSLDNQHLMRIDGQGISDSQITKKIREEIWKAYLIWKIQLNSCEIPNYSSGIKRKSKLQASKIEGPINEEGILEELPQNYKRQKVEDGQTDKNKNLNEKFENIEDIQVYQQDLETYPYISMNQQQIYAHQNIDPQHIQFQPYQGMYGQMDCQINPLNLSEYELMMNNGIHLQQIIQEPYLTEGQFKSLSIKDQQIYLYQMQQPMYVYAQQQQSNDEQPENQEKAVNLFDRQPLSLNHAQEDYSQNKGQNSNNQYSLQQENAEVIPENYNNQKF